MAPRKSFRHFFLQNGRLGFSHVIRTFPFSFRSRRSERAKREQQKPRFVRGRGDGRSRTCIPNTLYTEPYKIVNALRWQFSRTRTCYVAECFAGAGNPARRRGRVCIVTITFGHGFLAFADTYGFQQQRTGRWNFEIIDNVLRETLAACREYVFSSRENRLCRQYISGRAKLFNLTRNPS